MQHTNIPEKRNFKQGLVEKNKSIDLIQDKIQKVFYLYDASINAKFGELNENDDFEEECSFEGFFVSYLRNSNSDIRVWFKPDKWLKVYYGFSNKQVKGVFLLSRLAWTNECISILEVMVNYNLHSLNRVQKVFLVKMLEGANDCQEGLDIETVWLL